MRPTIHIMLGTAAAALLYPTLGATGAVAFVAGSVLVDLDHYIDFIYHNRFTDFSVAHMFEYHRVIEQSVRRPEMLNVEIFHTVEFMLPLFILYRFTENFTLGALFFGILFHIALDMVSLIKRKLFFIRCNSILEYLFRKKSMARCGLYPANIYSEAIRTISYNNLHGVR